MIKLDLLEKSYDDKVILKNFKLNINKGEIVHLVGKSGSGKTTLLRILMGLDKNFIGSLEVRAEKISTCFPDRVFLGHMSAMKEIKIVSKKDDSVIKNAFCELGLEGSEHKKASSFSTGMKSRLSIMRAMLYDSQVVFLDEPLIGLDDISMELAKTFIKKNLNKRTLIYSGPTLDIKETTIYIP